MTIALTRVGAAVAAVVCGLIGCSASTETTERDELTNSVGEAYGEAYCASATPDAQFNGGVWQRSPATGYIYGYTSPATYSNPHCYKAVVVNVTNWASPYQDLIVSAGDIATDSVSDKATCESRWLSVIMYPSSGASISRDAYGVWVPNGINAFSGHCTLPSVTMGGRGTRPGDFDALVAGTTYQVTATYRASTASSAKTMALTMFSPAPKCGLRGQACCTATAGSQCDSTSGDSVCTTSGTCQLCGELGQAACRVNGVLQCHQDVQPLTVVNGTCGACGAEYGNCCNNGINAACASSANVCEGGACMPCGGNGNYCCANNRCDAGGKCAASVCRTCGLEGQHDCAGRTCDPGLTPDSSDICRKTPVTPPTNPPPTQCGAAAGEPCCNGACNDNTGLLCETLISTAGPRCYYPQKSCGYPTAACCPDTGFGSQCDSATFKDNQCVMGYCKQVHP